MPLSLTFKLTQPRWTESSRSDPSLLSGLVNGQRRYQILSRVRSQIPQKCRMPPRAKPGTLNRSLATVPSDVVIRLSLRAIERDFTCNEHSDPCAKLVRLEA